MVARTTVLFSFVVLVLLMATPSHADSSLTTSVGFSVCGQASSSSSGNPVSTSCQVTTVIIPGDSATLAGSAQAKAMFGQLGTAAMLEGSCSLADLNIVNCQAFAGGFGAADASFADGITVSNAPSSGLLALSFTTTGFSQIACPGLDTCAGTYATTSYSTGNGWTLISNGTSTHTLDYGYSDGSGFIQLFLESFVSCQATDYSSCSATSNYIDTLQVTGLSVLDANGNLVTGAIVSADSGTDYNTLTSPPVSTPEPSSLVMLGAGLLGLAGLTLKKSL